jgi:hypothetical protein
MKTTGLAKSTSTSLKHLKFRIVIFVSIITSTALLNYTKTTPFLQLLFFHFLAADEHEKKGQASLFSGEKIKLAFYSKTW